MNSDSPITPPPELVKQWMQVNNMDIAPLHLAQALATQAARWGSDQELEACCLLLDDRHGRRAALYGAYNGVTLRAARRPKPPSLKAEAIEVLDELDGLFELPAGHYNVILRALEQLDDSL